MAPLALSTGLRDGSSTPSSIVGRTGQLNDGIGRAVVAVRRRQVDDLEVVGDALQERERAGRTLVVEGHERIVEDERRAPVAGHEAHEPEPRGQVDEVERALAEASRPGTQSPRSGAWTSMSSVLSSTRTRR